MAITTFDFSANTGTTRILWYGNDTSVPDYSVLPTSSTECNNYPAVAALDTTTFDNSGTVGYDGVSTYYILYQAFQFNIEGEGINQEDITSITMSFTATAEGTVSLYVYNFSTTNWENYGSGGAAFGVTLSSTDPISIANMLSGDSLYFAAEFHADSAVPPRPGSLSIDYAKAEVTYTPPPPSGADSKFFLVFP